MQTTAQAQTTQSTVREVFFQFLAADLSETRVSLLPEENKFFDIHLIEERAINIMRIQNADMVTFKMHTALGHCITVSREYVCDASDSDMYDDVHQDGALYAFKNADGFKPLTTDEAIEVVRVCFPHSIPQEVLNEKAAEMSTSKFITLKPDDINPNY
jgi:hypothetical protein